MSKGIEAMRAQRSGFQSELSPSVVEAGIRAYRKCVEESIAPPLAEPQVRAMVVRIWRAMEQAG